jgi:hypothetical protein
MNQTLFLCVGVGSTAVALLFSSIACTNSVTGSPSGDPPSSQSTLIGRFEVNVVKTGNTLAATVADATGSPVYGYEGPFTMNDQPVVKYTLANGSTGYHVFPQPTIPSQDYFAKAAYYDYIGTSRAASAEASYDLQGCDAFTKSVSCTSVGSCCDTHDACYAQNHCTEDSWLAGAAGELVSKCAACNAAVVGCFAAGGSGPAACCEAGTCKDPWGTPGQDGQCICQGKPSSCKSSACTGTDSGVKDSGTDGGKDGGTDADGGNDGEGDNGGGGDTTCDNSERAAATP